MIGYYERHVRQQKRHPYNRPRIFACTLAITVRPAKMDGQVMLHIKVANCLLAKQVIFLAPFMENSVDHYVKISMKNHYPA